jgi:phosphoserine aminotransferase
MCSRPVDVSKYAMIYGGAQKNIGPAGATFVIISDEMLAKVNEDRYIPTMLKYQTHVEGESMFNTPPVLPIYTIMETMRWLKELGGVEVMEKMNIEKAQILYDAIDNSKMFVGTAEKDSRSLMNICFVMKDQYKDKEADFLEYTKDRNISGIKGHRSVGGFRASTYNAMSKESIQYLVDVMNSFEKENL